MSDMRSAERAADRLALAILAAVAIAAAFTFQDYGLGWDDYTHSEYGSLLLALYGSGFSDTRALSFVNLYMYGGGFDMASALAAKVLPFGLFETRRLIGAAIGLLGLFATWRLGRRLGGPLAGLCALALLATCPLYYGHMFMNAKDAPFAVAMVVLLLGTVRALDEYPRPGPRTMVLVGVAVGVAFGSRILAVLAVGYAAAGLLLIVVEDIRSLSLRTAGARLGQFIVALLPALPLAYLIMGLLWPWSVLAPLNPVRAALYFDKFFEKPWKELYEGVLVAVPDMPATYLPHLLVLKLPELMLALGFGGCIGALIASVSRSIPLTRRAGLLTVALAAVLPIAIAMVTRPALYNGIRHFVFILPAFAVLGGLAAGWLIARARHHGPMAFGAAAALFVIGVGVPVIGMARLHPYEYTYFNPFDGGVRAAENRYMLDYWGLAFKQASDGLRTTLEARHESRPAARPWRVAVCGPQRPAEVALGADFKTTGEPRGADFAMMLGAFYCRELKAPVLTEIIRDGVVYARVYDIRGRNITDLLTQPPP